MEIRSATLARAKIRSAEAGIPIRYAGYVASHRRSATQARAKKI